MRFEAQVDALNLTPRPNRIGKDTNACTMPSITLYRDNFQLATIDDEELALFKAQFTTLLTMPGSDERKIMLDRLETYIIAMRAVKQALNGVKFSGIYAEDTELGMGFIRPQFTRAIAAYKVTWQVAVAAGVWGDWLFEAASNPFAVGRDFGLAITHLKSMLAIPLVSEVRFNVGRTQLLPLDTRNVRLADTVNNVAITAIPSMILIPKASFYARIKGDLVGGNDELAVGGLVFGLGRVLREEIAAWLP